MGRVQGIVLSSVKGPLLSQTEREREREFSVLGIGIFQGAGLPGQSVRLPWAVLSGPSRQTHQGLGV